MHAPEQHVDMRHDLVSKILKAFESINMRKKGIIYSYVFRLGEAVGCIARRLQDIVLDSDSKRNEWSRMWTWVSASS